MIFGNNRLLSVAIVVAAWGHAALPALADEPLLGGFVSAVSADSAAVRLEARDMAFVAPRVTAGTQSLVSSNGLMVTAWDTTALANGWQEVTESTGGGKVQLLVANLPSIAVEGGRLQSSVTWGADVVHWVRNRVIVPRGVTLTVAAGAVVKFGEQTGMFVEDGGTVKFNGNSSAPVVLTHFADDVYGGDSDFGATNAVWNSWSLTAQSGGTISDLYTQARYGTVGTFPTLSMPTAVTASRSTGKARVSVSFDAAPTKRAALTWRTVDGTAKHGVDFTKDSGTAVWVSGTTVYFDIPLVNLDDVQEVRTFTIELVTVEGANANPSRLKTTVSITGGDGAAEVPTCAVSEESGAIRLETRDPDPKPEPVPATIAIEGGRLHSNAIWDSSATNFVLNTVVVPSGITLTVVTNAVVHFTPNTGIKVEQGGVLRVVGSAEQPVVFTAAVKGDWTLTVVEGGAFSDSYALFEKATISQHPTVTVPNGCEVSEKDGEVRVPVAVSGNRTSAFRVKWRAIDGTAKFGEDYTLATGEVEWGGTSEGTKYITIPISNDDVEEESETFTVELYGAQGVNIGGSYRCSVLVRDGTAALVPVATCVESEESEAIRIETRDPDPKPEPVPATIAIEGGRLQSNAVWDSAATNFVLNTVVIPSGVTLTVVTNAVVYFAPYTGVKVEPGGALRCVGSQEGPVVFAAANDGDYTINVVSGGAFTDTWTAFRNLNYGGFGTATLDANLVVDADEGVIRIPVYISGSRTSAFSVDWEGSDGTTGTIVWNNANEGKKWIELPIEGRGAGFSLRLTEGRGINISGTAHEIVVKVFTSAAPKAVCAESAESVAVRLENREEVTLARALVFGTEYVSADSNTCAVAWDSTKVADGWQANGLLVRNNPSIAIEGGRLSSSAVWSNDVTHLVRNWVIVPNGATLRIEAGTVVKFCELTGFKVEAGGKLVVAGTEESPVVYTAAADDTIGGDSNLREATPNDGDYAVNIVSGGTYTDLNCAVRYATFSNLGTANVPAKSIAAFTDGLVRIPVYISTDRATKFCVDWRIAGDAPSAVTTNVSGRLTWNSKNDGTKYIELPLVSGALTNAFDAFTVELYESQGINISTTARRCDVTIYSNDRFAQGAYAESGESDAVRFETRAYDGDLEIEASQSIAIEGGRLQASTTWSNSVTHLVRQWVVVPSGVTLTIQAGTVVKFLPYTGIKVEPGGRVNANGTAANNIIFTSVADDTVGGDTDGKEAAPQNGNYSISVISGGTFSTAETQLRYGTSGTFGSLYIMENAVAKKDDGWVKIPVCVSASSPEAFSVDWEVVESSVVGRAVPSAPHGRLDWSANSTATKYIDIPLDRMAEAVEGETFTVELTFTRGINLNQSRKSCLVTLYDTVNALAGANVGHAESGWCDFAPIDASAGTGPMFAMGEVPLRYSTRWADNGAGLSISVADATVGRAVPSAPQSTLIHESSTPAEGSTIWNGADYEDGRYDLTHKILDADGRTIKIDSAAFIVNRDVVEHGGRLAADETWAADKVHLVVATVTVPSGVTLTIAPDAIVKFMPGASIVVEKGGLGICKGAVLTHAYDDVMGGDTFFDGAETVPEDGGYSLSGDWEDDESTQYRYSMPLEVSGTLRGENRWPGHKTYIVTGNITLASGATLTIDAGAVVKFKSGLSFTVNSGATLNAQGMRSSPVVFTSFKDDTHGGDTNGDGGATTAERGDWRYIWVYGKANLDYAQVLYGGMADGSYGERGPLMTSGSGSLNMNGCYIAHSLYDGVWNWGGTIVAKNCVITDTGWATAPYRGSKNEYVNCIFYGNDAGMCYWSSWGGKPVYRNCIFAECGHGWCEINEGSYGDPPSGVTVANCLFWNSPDGGAQSCGLVGKNGNIWGNPLFVEDGFRIDKYSPCVDAGDAAYAPEMDYYGQSRQGDAPEIGICEVMGRPVLSDIDLAVESVSSSEVFEVGKKIELTWTVKNIGSESAVGRWTDKIELVCANGSAVPLGEESVSAVIPPDGQKTFVRSFTVPSAQIGSVRVRVTANCNGDISEGTLRANNVAESEAATLTMPELVFADDASASFNLAAGGSVGYRLGSGFADGGLLIVHVAGAMGAANPVGGVKVWTGNGQVPTADIFYASAVEVGGGDYLVRVPAGGDGYVSFANGGSGSAKVYIEAETGAFLLFDTGVVTAPNAGTASLTLFGNGFEDGMEVFLVGRAVPSAPQIPATDIAVFDAIHAVATFDVTGLAAGAYEVHVKKGDEEAAASLLTLTETRVGPKWSCKLDVASTVRTSKEYVGYLEYSNAGDMPMAVPYVKLSAGGGALIRLGSADAWGETLELMAISDTYPVSQLKPGETRRIPFRYKPISTSGYKIDYSVTYDDPSTFPWDTNASYMRPSWASDELWGLSLAVLKSNVGATWNDYLARMRANCDHLAKIGQPTHRLDRIWQLEINEALGVDHAVSTLASNTDLARSGRGFGLALSRSYGSGLYRRLRKGIFGYGWSDNYSAYAELQNSGATLALHSGSGSTYLFEKVNGKWTPEDARDKTTCTETSSEYVLTYRSGTVQRIAKSNMRVSSVTDNQGNSLAFTYNADKQLVKVEHCDGQSLSFTYAGGLLASATDDQGRTTRYEYSGDLLMKVTAFNGLSTQYRYLPADDSVTSRALSQIRYADGTTRDYTYDGAGRVATVSINGNLQTVEIERGALGSYAVIAPNGGATTVTLGASGEVRETVNALGQKSARTYTADTLLESVVGPTGKRAKIAYDEDGQAVKATDAAGADTLFGYTSDFGNLAKVTDARGNSFDYGYDKLGRSKSISYADGSVESIAYDDRGNVTNSVNRRGQSITFTYDNEGNTLSKVWENGRTFTWAYDAKGNCTNATDSATGTVTMEYDENERLTRIVHPKGRGFAYTYDSLGRTISRTTLGGTGSVPSAADIQRYEYDSLGRLSRMTDGDGNLYVENAYDPVTGWLVTQTYGNGTIVSNAYDILGRTVGIYHGRARSPSAPLEILAFFEYAYDAEGRRISQTTAEGVERYTYDTVGQLTDVIYPDGSEEHFTYDAVGNRISRTGCQPVQEETYAANNLNQYTEIVNAQAARSTIEYDLDGNMTRKGDTRYYYDIQNRLVAVTNTTTDIAWSCEYDVFGNRTKVIDHGTAKETLFVQGSLASAVADYDAEGAVATRHILLGSVRIADWESRHLGGGDENTIRYYHSDGLASTRLLTDANGEAIGTASYRAFGEVRTTGGSQAATAPSAGWVGILGVERDDATGLIFMRNRYYDAEQGRFIQMDPISILAGDVNLLRYCDNDPLNFLDASGLLKIEIKLIFGCIKGAATATKDAVKAIPPLFKMGKTTKETVSEGRMLTEGARLNKLGCAGGGTLTYVYAHDEIEDGIDKAISKIDNAIDDFNEWWDGIRARLGYEDLHDETDHGAWGTHTIRYTTPWCDQWYIPMYNWGRLPMDIIF